MNEKTYPEPGSEIPDQPGYVVGKCGHRIATSEWRAGFRTCERCPAEQDGGGKATTPTTHLDAARVLTGIIRRAEEAGLPLLHWSLHPHTTNLSASPYVRDDDETQSATMAAWAAHLGVEVETERHASYTGAEIETVIDGVRVQIWAHVDRSAAYGQAGGA